MLAGSATSSSTAAPRPRSLDDGRAQPAASRPPTSTWWPASASSCGRTPTEPPGRAGDEHRARGGVVRRAQPAALGVAGVGRGRVVQLVAARSPPRRCSRPTSPRSASEASVRTVMLCGVDEEVPAQRTARVGHAPAVGAEGGVVAGHPRAGSCPAARACSPTRRRPGRAVPSSRWVTYAVARRRRRARAGCAGRRRGRRDAARSTTSPTRRRRARPSRRAAAAAPRAPTAPRRRTRAPGRAAPRRRRRRETQVHAAHDALDVDALRLGRLDVGLVVERQVVEDVLGLLAVHPAQAVLDDVPELVAVRRVVGDDGRVGARRARASGRPRAAGPRR